MTMNSVTKYFRSDLRGVRSFLGLLLFTDLIYFFLKGDVWFGYLIAASLMFFLFVYWLIFFEKMPAMYADYLSYYPMALLFIWGVPLFLAEFGKLEIGLFVAQVLLTIIFSPFWVPYYKEIIKREGW